MSVDIRAVLTELSIKIRCGSFLSRLLVRISKGAISLKNRIPVLRVKVYEVGDRGVKKSRRKRKEEGEYRRRMLRAEAGKRAWPDYEGPWILWLKKLDIILWGKW